jgi:DNA-binding Lrp family transcriptional regulator
MPRDLFAEQEERKKSEPKDLFAERGISITPEAPAEPEGSDLIRGFTSYGPQLKETYGGAKVLAGKALGSEAMMKSGIESMEEAKHALRSKSKPTDSFTTALDKGMGAVLTDWLPYQIGSGAANILESLAVMGAGAAVGSAVGSTVPVVGTGAGVISGGIFGLVEKELIKTGVRKAAKELLEKEGEEIAKKFVEEKAAIAAKKVARNVAATSALAAQAGFHGAGETTSRAVEEAQRLGKEATDIEMGRVVPAAIVHGVAEFIGDKIGLGAFNKLDLNQKNLLLNFGKNLVVTGTKEAPVEAIQSAAERFGAELSLTDAEAIKEYVDSAAAAYAMSVVPAAGGAVKSRGMAGIEERNKELESQFRQDIQQEEADAVAASQKAETAAQDITTVGVPDEQGNVAPLKPISFDVMAPNEIAAAEAATAAQDKDVTAAIPEQTVPKENQAITELVGDAYAEHGTGKKVLETLKPQLEAMGIPVEEHKKVIEEARTALNIPRNDTKEGRAAMPVWAQQWPTQKESLNVPTTINAAADQSSITGAPPAVGGTPTGAKTSDVSGMVDTGRDATADNVAKAAQPAALIEEQNRIAEEMRLAEEARLAEVKRLQAEALAEETPPVAPKEKGLTPKQIKDGYELLLKEHGDELPAWKDLTPDLKKSLMGEIKDALKTKSMLPSKGATPQVSPVIATLKKNKAIINSYNENRPGRLREWETLNDDERDIYLSQIKNNTAEEQDKAYSALQSYLKSNEQVTEEGGVEEGGVPQGASIYELNRQAYSSELPRWGDLDDSARNVFLKSIERGFTRNKKGDLTKREVTTEQMDEAFTDVWIHNAEKESRVVSPLKEREEQAQKDRKQRMQEEREEVSVGKELPTNIKQLLKDGDIKGVLAYISKNAKGMAYTVPYKAGRVQDDVVLFFQKQREFISSTVFKNLSKVLSTITYDSKVVIDPDNKVIQQLKKEGKLAAYDPKTDTFYFTKDGLDEQTVLHEIVHAATIKIMYAFKTNPASLTNEQREAAQHIEKIFEVASKNASLKNKHPYAFENVYEFVSYAMTDIGLQQDLANIQSPNLSKYTANNLGFLRSITGRFGTLWGQFTQSLMKLYGLVKGHPTVVPSTEINDTFIKAVNEASQEEQGFSKFNKGPQGRIIQRTTESRVSPTNISAAFKQPGYKGSLIIEMSEAFGRILAAPEAGIDIEALPAKKPKAAPTTDRSIEELESEMKTGKQPAAPSKVWSAVLSGKTGPWLEKKFANDRAPIKRWQKQLADAGRVIAYGVGMNNIYDQIVLSSGNAHYIYTQYVQAGTESLRQEIAAYADKNKLSVEEALQKLALYSIARHLPERREVLYMREVPLSSSPIIKFTNAQGQASNISPAQMRDEIFKELDTNKNLTEAEIKYFNKTLRSITFDKSQTFLDPKVKGKDLANINSSKYNVAGAFSDAEVKTMMGAYNANKAEVQPIFDVVDKLNKTTLKLNKMSNYMSPYADNWIKFYGWENYVPLKGKHLSDETDMLNFDSRRLGGELQEKVHTFEGNQEIPDNPVLQVMADAALASMRVGRKNITETIYNSSKKSKNNPNGSGLLPTAEVMKVVDFEDRRDQKFLDSLGGETKIFHYMPDGKVAVISIKDKNLLEAIRRSYREINPFIDFLNKATGVVGQFHTRFNIAFAPINFARDVLTNAFTIGADMGPLKAFNYLGSVAKDVATGKLWKTVRFNYLYSKGEVGALRTLAAKDQYYKDLLDLTKTGGRVSWLAGIANKGQFNELNKEVGTTGILSPKQAIKFFDGYIEAFEMASRVAAFRIAKQTELAELKRQNITGAEAEKTANTKAASYTKELANFEQSGEWGKTMGAWFMFFRPSATGAVRAIDAVAPAIMNAEQARMRQPQFAEAAMLREKLKDKSITGITRTKMEAKLKDAEKAIQNFDEKFAKNKQNAQVMVACLIGMGYLTYQMAHAMADDDDNKDELGRNKIATDDMSRWTKFARFYIPGIERPLQIPWGFGLGAFAAMGAQIGAMFNGNIKPGESLSNMVPIVLDSFLPLPVSRIPVGEKPLEYAIDSALPSIIRPFVEYAMNVDALGRQIYNNRQSRFGEAYTGGDNIPELYKKAARWWFDTTGNDVSPNSLYFFANSYADGASRVMHNGTNISLWLAGKKDFDPKTDTIFFDSFVGSKSNYDARQWQRIEDDLKEREQKINMLKNNKPDQYLAYLSKNPLDEMLADMYNHDVNGHLKDLREQANKYRAMDTLSPKERKEIVDAIVLQQNFEKYRLVQMYKAFGVKP